MRGSDDRSHADGHGTPREAARTVYGDGPTTGKLDHVVRREVHVGEFYMLDADSTTESQTPYGSCHCDMLRYLREDVIMTCGGSACVRAVMVGDSLRPVTTVEAEPTSTLRQMPPLWLGHSTLATFK